MQKPLATSQTRAVRSAEVVTSSVPVGSTPMKSTGVACALNVRTLRPVRASHTVHRIERDAENTSEPSRDHVSAVIGSVSPSSACTTFPVATSTMFTASTHAVATKVPSGDRRTGPPVWNTSRLDAAAYVLRGCA